MNQSKNNDESIISALIDKYGCSLDYVRKSLRGDRTGLMPDKLIEEYNKMKEKHQGKLQI